MADKEYSDKEIEEIVNEADKLADNLTEEERKEIAACVQAKCAPPNCVSIVDGALFPLEFCPQQRTLLIMGWKHLCMSVV